MNPYPPLFIEFGTDAFPRIAGGLLGLVPFESRSGFDVGQAVGSVGLNVRPEKNTVTQSGRNPIRIDCGTESVAD